MSTRSTSLPLGTLLVLTAAVTIAHGLILGWMPLTFDGAASAQPVRFQTRTLQSVQAQPTRQQPPDNPSRKKPSASTSELATPGPTSPQASTVPGHEAEPSPAAQAPAPDPVPAVSTSTSTHAALPSAKVPESVRLHYELQVNSRGMANVADAVLEFKQDAQQYEARLEFRKFGMAWRTDRSAGVVSPVGLEPRRFAQKSRQEQATHFLPEQGKISFSNNRPDAPLLPGAQDRLSVLLQLAALWGADAGRYPPGTQVQLQVAGADRADPWVFKVEGDEVLSLPMGEVKAVKLQRVPAGEYAQRVEVWLSAQVGWLPVRVRITQSNGDVADQLLRNTQR